MKITCYSFSGAELGILQCFQINQMSEAPAAKKAKLRHYHDDFIMFGFVSADAKPICLECGIMLTNDSMKKVKLLHHQISKHPSSVGKERKKKTKPVKLFDFVKKMNTANAKTLIQSYLVSAILAKVGAPQVYGEKLIKLGMLACATKSGENMLHLL